MALLTVVTSQQEGLLNNENSDELIEHLNQFDQDSQQQALEFEWKEGVKQIAFNLDMSIFGGTDVQQMAQYLATLDTNLEDSRDNSKDHNNLSAFDRKNDSTMRQGLALFKGAMANMSSVVQRYSNLESVAAQQFTDGRAMVAELVDNMITHDPRYQGLGSGANAGISKLADFDGQFSFLHEEWGRILPKISVEMSQVTEHKKSGEFSGVTQSKSVSNGFKYQSLRSDYYEKTENYTIGTAVKNKQLIGLGQHHQVNIDQKTYRSGENLYQFNLMMSRSDGEQVTHDSSIRLIDDIWLETNENSERMNKNERIVEGIIKPKISDVN